MAYAQTLGPICGILNGAQTKHEPVHFWSCANRVKPVSRVPPVCDQFTTVAPEVAALLFATTGIRDNQQYDTQRQLGRHGASKSWRIPRCVLSIGDVDGNAHRMMRFASRKSCDCPSWKQETLSGNKHKKSAPTNMSLHHSILS